MRSITVNELHSLICSGCKVDLLDVRTPAEHAAAHVAGTRVEPVDKLNCHALLSSRAASSNEPIYILCHSGARAAQAADKFAKAGFDNAVVVEGGTQAWISAGFPVECGRRKVLPLDRQVRTVAGMLALTGALLAHFYHPLWIWLSGFVGFGLIVAGLTDFCPMRSLLAAMPWNQTEAARKANSCCCEA
jgi:rhodanese-related sulfurtransferase